MSRYTKHHGWENEDTFIVTLYCLSDLYNYFCDEGLIPDVYTVKSIVLDAMWEAENDASNRLNDVKLINVNFSEIVQCITEDLYWRENSLNSLC
jgi:hypothetical protein